MHPNLEIRMPTRLKRYDLARMLRARFTPAPTSKLAMEVIGGAAQTLQVVTNKVDLIVCDCCLVVMRLVQQRQARSTGGKRWIFAEIHHQRVPKQVVGRRGYQPAQAGQVICEGRRLARSRIGWIGRIVEEIREARLDKHTGFRGIVLRARGVVLEALKLGPPSIQ